MGQEHYICVGGCGGVADTPGVCQAPTCPKHGQALLYCDCDDGKHYGRQAKHVEETPVPPPSEGSEDKE